MTQNGFRCPICRKKEYCEEHVLAYLDTTLSDINDGILLLFVREIDALLLKATMTLLASGTLKSDYPLFSAIVEIADFVPENETKNESYISREYYGNYYLVIEGLQNYLDSLMCVYSSGEYEVDEFGGTFKHQDYWTHDPTAVVEDLLKKLREGICD